MSYCTGCGTGITDANEKFCHNCGAPVQAPPAAAPMMPGPGMLYAPPPPPKRNVGLIVGISIGVVVFLGAILAAIAVPTFLGQRAKADDAAAKSLVRNAMTAVESAYVDVRSFSSNGTLATTLRDVEPTITFITVASEAAAIQAHGCRSEENEVYYWGQNLRYALGTESESGTCFAVSVDKGAGGGNTFYTDGAPVDIW